MIHLYKAKRVCDFYIIKPEESYYTLYHLYFRLKRIPEVIVVMKPCPVRMNQSMQILHLRSILKRNRRAAKPLRVTVYKRMMNIISKTITKKFNNTFLKILNRFLFRKKFDAIIAYVFLPFHKSLKYFLSLFK